MLPARVVVTAFVLLMPREVQATTWLLTLACNGAATKLGEPCKLLACVTVPSGKLPLTGWLVLPVIVCDAVLLMKAAQADTVDVMLALTA